MGGNFSSVFLFAVSQSVHGECFPQKRRASGLKVKVLCCEISLEYSFILYIWCSHLSHLLGLSHLNKKKNKQWIEVFFLKTILINEVMFSDLLFLVGGLRKKDWMRLHETWWEDGAWRPRKDPLNSGIDPDKWVDIGILITLINFARQTRFCMNLDEIIYPCVGVGYLLGCDFMQWINAVLSVICFLYFMNAGSIV